MQWRHVVSGAVVAGLLLSGCSRQESGSANEAKQKVDLSARNFAPAWQDETQYIVTTIAADLVEMAYHARHKQSLPTKAGTPPVTVEEVSGGGAVLTYRVRAAWQGAEPLVCDLPLDQGIWSPVTYRPLGRMLADRLELKPTPGEVLKGDELFQTLTELTAERLARIDLKLSQELKNAFLDSERHERAAFLLGAFALREPAGLFFQIRVELCRMTAHLAFADLLRAGKEPSLTGRLAEAVLAVLQGDETRTLRQLAELPNEGAAGVWQRVLRTRATRDYRIIQQPEEATLVEALEWYRAYSAQIDSMVAWGRRPGRENWQALADWSRLTRVRKPSIQLGHELLRSGLRYEMEELASVHKISEGRELPDSEVVAVLNREPARCVTAQTGGAVDVRILGTGLWTAFLQRQLCANLAADFDFLQNRWGVPDEAAKYREGMDKFFWKLSLYPFVRRQLATDVKYYRAAQEDEMAVIRSRPEIVPAGAWNYVCYEVPFGAIYIPPPHAFLNEWHRHNPPPGSVYDIEPRLNHPSLTSQPDSLARLERLHEEAPHQPNLNYVLLRTRHGKKPSPEQLLGVYAAVMDYDPSPSYQLSELVAGDPVAQEKWLRRAAALDPWFNLSLGELYRERGQEEQAAEAYAGWIRVEADDVAVSNQAGWLVFYYERNNRKREAQELAERAARTYSARGLETLAQLLEGRGEFDRALEVYEKETERYRSPGPLIGFLMRRKQEPRVDQERYGKRLDELLRSVNLSELRRFDIATETGPPTTGVSVFTESSRIVDAGLKAGDIIVAVRGYAVTGWVSFKAVRGFDPSQPYEMVVWRDGRYRELKPIPGDYRFGVDLVDYKR